MLDISIWFSDIVEQNSWQCQVSDLTELRRKQNKRIKIQKIEPEKKKHRKKWDNISIKIGNCNWSAQIYVHVCKIYGFFTLINIPENTEQKRNKILGAWSVVHEAVC